MIQISKLSLVNSPEKFFSVKKILYVEILNVDTAAKTLKRKLERKFGAFKFEDKPYLTINLKGSPENLFLKLRNGISFDFGDGDGAEISVDGKLQETIDQKKIFNFTDQFKRGKLKFAKEIDLLAERYILPYRKLKQNSANCASLV